MAVGPYSARTGQARLGYRPSKKSIKRVVEHVHALRRIGAASAIYGLDADTLTICDNAQNLDERRPTAFEAKSGIRTAPMLRAARAVLSRAPASQAAGRAEAAEATPTRPTRWSGPRRRAQ